MATTLESLTNGSWKLFKVKAAVKFILNPSISVWKLPSNVNPCQKTSIICRIQITQKRLQSHDNNLCWKSSLFLCSRLLYLTQRGRRRSWKKEWTFIQQILNSTSYLRNKLNARQVNLKLLCFSYIFLCPCVLDFRHQPRHRHLYIYCMDFCNYYINWSDWALASASKSPPREWMWHK